ncbi:MAG TPA: mechanosensitive ion channel domain-containing protein [Thermomicrobiales bacterium]|nr:mechanosensitive ion channel domain-containing protein [Thermomicrobiales bacterium]
MAGFWHNFVKTLEAHVPDASYLALFIVRLAQVVVVSAVTLIVATVLKRRLVRIAGRSRINPNVIALAGNGIFVLVLFFGFAWLLALFGASWAAVLASLSVVSVAFGLALQDVLKNFVAGVYLLLEQPFKIGDHIAVKGVTGEVEGIDIRTTVMRTPEGLRVIVPNNIVFTDIVTNRSAYGTRRVSLQLEGVQAAFGDLSRLVNDALAPFDEIDRAPAPQITIQTVEDGHATVAVDYWQRGVAPILPDVLARLKAAFPAAKITIVSSGDITAK